MLSGQIGIDDEGIVLDGMTAQSERIFDIVESLLGAYGATLADVVNIRTYMLDLGRLAEYGAGAADQDGRAPAHQHHRPGGGAVQAGRLGGGGGHSGARQGRHRVRAALIGMCMTSS